MIFVLDQLEVGGEKTTTRWLWILQLQVFSLQERMASIHWQHMSLKSGHGMITVKENGTKVSNTLVRSFSVSCWNVLQRWWPGLSLFRYYRLEIPSNKKNSQETLKPFLMISGWAQMLSSLPSLSLLPTSPLTKNMKKWTLLPPFQSTMQWACYSFLLTLPSWLALANLISRSHRAS